MTQQLRGGKKELRTGKSRDGVWKKVETKVDLDYLGEAERTWAHIFKEKKKKATLAVS